MIKLEYARNTISNVIIL